MMRTHRMLASLALVALWADALLTKRALDVLSLGRNLNVLVAEGRVTLFGDVNERGTIRPNLLSPRVMGVPR